jgi:uncharacterized protein
MKKGILLIMARAPRFGAVKTRLARDIGPLKAWHFYRNTLTATARRLSRSGKWHTVLQVTPDRDKTSKRQWPRTHAVIGQGRGDIGARMEHGLTAFPRGVPVVLIGSDIPGVLPHHIQRAFKALGQADVVFGPATDGGYWLVGFANRRPVRRSFKNVRWSTPQALTDTQENMRHLRRAFVDELNDVDDGASYQLMKT